MSEYEKQAADFLEKTGAKIEARFLDCRRGYFTKTDPMRDIYEVRIIRGDRFYLFNFGTSINDTDARIRSIIHIGHDGPQNVEAYKDGKELSWMQKPRYTAWRNEAAEWKRAGTGTRPTEYDILSSLTKYEPPADVDEFAVEFGYTSASVSDAVRAHKAVLDEWANIQRLFSDEEIAALQEIQ